MCRALIYSQPTPNILGALGDLLITMWTTFGDIDIRDHARFYYMLLTNVSGQKLRDILRPAAWQEHSYSAIMTDNMLASSQFLSAHPVSMVGQPLLVLTLGHEVSEHGAAASPPPVATLDQYVNFVAGTSVERAVAVRVTVAFTPTSAPPEHSVLYGVVLSFQVGNESGGGGRG